LIEKKTVPSVLVKNQRVPLTPAVIGWFEA
jgi:hypothetical protein